MTMYNRCSSVHVGLYGIAYIQLALDANDTNPIVDLIDDSLSGCNMQSIVTCDEVSVAINKLKAAKVMVMLA